MSEFQSLKVSDNRRFLLHRDNTPFFYLADTAWELLHRTTREDAEHYLQDRAAKGFTVIQAVALAEENGLHDPNPMGETPLIEDDPAHPNSKYFEHVDFVVRRAAELGLTIGMLPTWGDKWNKGWGQGPQVFTPENARAYGQWLGQRYQHDANIIWILGGDRTVDNDTQRAIIDAMAKGLAEGDGGSHLKTFHPYGGGASSQYFHDSEWLDFNMWQSGHDRNRDNYNCIAQDYTRATIKPVLDGEPGYEDHKAGFQLQNGILGEYDNRKALYWATFAGACGHTYGCHAVWQFWQPGHRGVNHPLKTWRDSLHLPGAAQMHFARRLLESRPYLSRIPDQEMIVAQPSNDKGEEQRHLHVRATRDANGSYALVYFPTDSAVELNLSALSGDTIRVQWFNPRDGQATPLGEWDKANRIVTPPEWGPDWVLVLDDASQNFGAPGQFS